MSFRFIALVVLMVVLTSANAHATKRIALLIGNQDYKRGVGRLVNPLNDIRIVGRALRKVGFEVLKPVKNGTRVDILDALEHYTNRLKNAGSDAIGLIYYSGHGIASKGTNYLIPVDLEKPSTRLLRANGVKQSEVLSLIRTEAPKAAHYVIIDACRNELQGARGGKGFVAVNQRAGTLIAFATSPGRTASDVGRGGGPYAKALAAQLVKPGVTDLQMFSNVRFAVSTATGGDQVPWTLDGIVRRDRVMFGGMRRSDPTPAALAAAAWQKIKGTRDPKKLRAFADRYKGTDQAQLAMFTAREIERKQAASRKTEEPPRSSVTDKNQLPKKLSIDPSQRLAEAKKTRDPAKLRAFAKTVPGTRYAKRALELARELEGSVPTKRRPQSTDDVIAKLEAAGFTKVQVQLEAPTLTSFLACKDGKSVYISTNRYGEMIGPPKPGPTTARFGSCSKSFEAALKKIPGREPRTTVPSQLVWIKALEIRVSNIAGGKGVRVEAVAEGSNTQKDGLRAGDVIVEVADIWHGNPKQIRNIVDLTEKLAGFRYHFGKDRASIKFRRKDQVVQSVFTVTK